MLRTQLTHTSLRLKRKSRQYPRLRRVNPSVCLPCFMFPAQPKLTTINYSSSSAVQHISSIMLFSRVVSFLVFFVTMGAFALSTPVQKRSDAQLETVFTTLKSSTDAILPQISAMATSGQASETSLTPLVNQLVEALTTAQGSLSSIGSGSLLVKRVTDEAVAELISGIVSDIAITLNLGVIPTLTILLGDVDVILSEVLTTVNIIAGDVFILLRGLLGTVDGLLAGLGLTLGLLGL
ncbi:hypothetical protein EW145_g557 [Phellinidium pouzarii]|uniref:Uncharacterized protein n=1 Tax=Phellinidium pouzarii TaxID=167371 RepID=A0A4S4LI43_9AGAM|nr:hypothetical protein EW145_g557 [Phellinidium pouzarii]